jgi:hypothetical protein
MSLKKLSKRLRTPSKSKSKLRSRIEVETTPEQPDSGLGGSDTLDPDLLQYVDNFLMSYSNMAPLEPTSLLTKEDAQKALVVLEKANEQVQSHLKTARALKQLLESKKREGL